MKNLSLILMLLIFQFSISQESINSSGGNINSLEESVSYSIGQVFYIENEGIQYHYIDVSLSTKDNIIETQVLLYPNPTNDKVTVLMEKGLDAKYIMYDIDGKTVSYNNISDGSIIYLPEGNNMYIIKIFISNKLVKNFKIIKK